MSWFGDAFAFDKFALSDMWEKIKDDPERLLVGAVTPWTTKMWNKALGKDWEPMVDQMGGPYGGHTISAFGNKDGGVYARAEQAGIDTKAGGTMHDAAHVIAAIYGGAALGNAAGGLLGSGGAAPSSGFGGASQGVNIGEAGAGAATKGTGAGASGAAGGFNWMNAFKQMNPQGLLGGGEQQQPVVMQPPPQNNNDALRMQLARQQRAQQLRSKIRRTPDEDRELRELTRVGLLG